MNEAKIKACVERYERHLDGAVKIGEMPASTDIKYLTDVLAEILTAQAVGRQPEPSELPDASTSASANCSARNISGGMVILNFSLIGSRKEASRLEKIIADQLHLVAEEILTDLTDIAEVEWEIRGAHTTPNS